MIQIFNDNLNVELEIKSTFFSFQYSGGSNAGAACKVIKTIRINARLQKVKASK